MMLELILASALLSQDPEWQPSGLELAHTLGRVMAYGDACQHTGAYVVDRAGRQRDIATMMAEATRLGASNSIVDNTFMSAYREAQTEIASRLSVHATGDDLDRFESELLGRCEAIADSKPGVLVRNDYGETEWQTYWQQRRSHAAVD